MKIRRILNDLGAVSKQAIIGGAIGVATLVVGIGLMNNFTTSDSEQGFASNALERSYSSYDASYSGAGTSAQDIMSARNYSYGEKKSVITGTENLVLNRRSSASGQAGVGAQGYGDTQAGAYSDGTSAYGAGELEGMGTSNKITVDLSQEEEAKAKAQRDAKIAKGEAFGKQARGTLKTSKMADSSGIKGMPTGSTSMTYGTMGSSGSKAAAGTADSSKVSLGQAGLSNVNLQAAKAGKLSAMGARGVEADGKKLGRASVGQSYQTLGDLGRAVKYSRSAKQTVSSDSALGASDAAAAFDGSKEADAVNLDGENLQAAAVSSLKDMGAPDMNLDLDKIREDLEQIDETMEKYNQLMEGVKDCIWSMVLFASAASIAVGIFSKIEPWGAIAAAASAAVGTAGVAASLIAAYVLLGKINNLAQSSGIDNLKPSGWDWAMPGLIGGVLVGFIWLAWGLAGMDPTTIAKEAGKKALSFGLKAVKTMASSGLLTSLGNFFSKIGKKK